jgi:hypothetical protein
MSKITDQVLEEMTALDVSAAGASPYRTPLDAHPALHGQLLGSVRCKGRGTGSTASDAVLRSHLISRQFTNYRS